MLIMTQVASPFYVGGVPYMLMYIVCFILLSYKKAKATIAPKTLVVFEGDQIQYLNGEGKYWKRMALFVQSSSLHIINLQSDDDGTQVGIQLYALQRVTALSFRYQYHISGKQTVHNSHVGIWSPILVIYFHK